MSIKRFSPDIEGMGLDTGPYPVMEECEDGLYVHYVDYEHQCNALLAALTSALQELSGIEPSDKTKAEKNIERKLSSVIASIEGTNKTGEGK